MTAPSTVPFRPYMKITMTDRTNGSHKVFGTTDPLDAVPPADAAGAEAARA